MNRAVALAAWLAFPLGYVAEPAAGVQVRQEGPTLEELLEERDQRVRLPGRLREISGLATDGEGRLWGHNDERGAIYPIDPATGEVGEGRVLGPTPVRGDFEGLAWDGARFHLVTSEGTLFSFAPGDDEEVTEYVTRETEAADWCEVEGLDFDAELSSLILACKNVKKRGYRDHTVLLAVSLADLAAPTSEEPLPVSVALSIPEEELETLDLPAPLKLTGVALHPLRRSWVLVAAPKRRVVEVTREGRVVASVKLDSGRHPQPEGLALDATGSTVFLADEGSGERGRVSTYRVGSEVR